MSSSASAQRHDHQTLDELTGGAFTAPTAGERAARIRAWLQQEPAPEQMQIVYRELSVKDKGAAKLLRERLDELKRQREQEGLAQEWAQKAQALLDAPRLHLADALAWQRDAAKAGAPLSREPLASMKLRLADRIKAIEDLQHRVQVQREAAVLLAQRIEVLTTKSWLDAQAAAAGLARDVAAWQEVAAALPEDPDWASVDLRFPPQLETSRAQLALVWEAFRAALTQAQRAAAEAAADLPQVPVWADELRQARGVPAEVPVAAPLEVDPARQAQATATVQEVLVRLEQEIAQGHGKASAGAANALRQALKEHGRFIDAQLDRKAHAALAAAGELEGWQRWRADQLREELVAKAEALLHRPEGQTLGGRKMQEALRELREQWKQTDQGGVPNHALWKRFDEACNQAHKVVEVWLEKVRSEAAANKTARVALIEEFVAWAQAHPGAPDQDWKAFNRELHQFAERWRNAGHLGEKVFAELQSQWKVAMAQASAPLEIVQKDSLQRRQAMVEEATRLGGAATLHLDAVKALQQRWQAEAHAVPLERRQEQKLWDAFRKPLDEAFARKSAARAQAVAAMSEHDRDVLQAAQALEVASASGDAQAIRAALDALEAARRATAPAAAAAAAEVLPAAEGAPPPAEPAAARKPVVAMRGDDRPGARRAEPMAPPVGGRAARPLERGRERRRETGHAGELPRLGDAAFRAQRDAIEHAQAALKKLAVQAHGEALAHLIDAWEQRDAARLPPVAELGRVTPSVRSLWSQALAAPAAASADEALLRLEVAAEVPTPAADLEARRALQLQLLTRRHEPAPSQTWGQDVARVLATAYEAAQARRLQQALKVLLKR